MVCSRMNTEVIPIPVLSCEVLYVCLRSENIKEGHMHTGVPFVMLHEGGWVGEEERREEIKR